MFHLGVVNPQAVHLRGELEEVVVALRLSFVVVWCEGGFGVDVFFLW